MLGEANEKWLCVKNTLDGFKEPMQQGVRVMMIGSERRTFRREESEPEHLPGLWGACAKAP